MRAVTSGQALRVVIVAFAYYVGGHIDAVLGWNASPAILWPPNAVLLAALLLAPVRLWWLYALAVLPADRANSWGLPLSAGLSLYASNVVQSLAAASLIRLTGPTKPRWDDHVYVLRFVGFAVFVGPVVGGLFGAAAIGTFRHGASYWLLWRGWAMANALTMLTFVPVLTLGAQHIAATMQEPAIRRARRAMEAAAVFISLIAVTVVVFERQWSPVDAWTPLLFAPLPLLWWASLRFAPAGAAVAQFLLVLIAIHGVAHGRGPFPAGTSADHVLPLQLLLISVSLPWLLLAAILHAELMDRRALTAAQEDMHTLRERLAHVGRLSTLGEMTAAVAHELYQPLTAILNNAEAASRFLDAPVPDMNEVRDALHDIADDVRRATDASLRLRSLLKKGDINLKSMDLNDVIRQVMKLVSGDATSRKVAIEQSLDPTLPAVWGDRTQIQQVVLNLVMNGFEAMRDVPPTVRTLQVRTELLDPATVRVSVADHGTGVDANNLNRVFEPFFTTKQDGLGIGLSISRTIIEAHGGRFSIANNSDRGATLQFTLPTKA